jgi:hypothetical protein
MMRLAWAQGDLGVGAVVPVPTAIFAKFWDRGAFLNFELSDRF